MNSNLSRNVVELLERKYYFLETVTKDTFLLDLNQFVVFLINNELIRPFSERLYLEFNTQRNNYQSKCAYETKEAIEIKDLILKLYPGMDDRNIKRPTSPFDTEDYKFSFAEFENIVGNNRSDFGTPLEPPGIYEDDSNVAKLIEILKFKVSSYESPAAQPKKKIDDAIKNKLRSMAALHHHTHREWINYQRISPGWALFSLMQIVFKINPEPQGPTQFRIMSRHERANKVFEPPFRRYEDLWVDYSVYGRSSNTMGYQIAPEKLKQNITEIKKLLRRVYEAIRQEIGTTQLYLQLINRYSLRSHWYNQSHLRDLVEVSKGKYKRNREDLLTKDLALFLFDNGVTAQYRTRFGKHEFDLLGIDIEDPIFIEAKAYKDSSAKRELIDGIAQLHSYLSNLEGYKSIREAYYVVYRLAGPIYEFPEMITTNKFQIFPVLVDLGLSQESGRKQPKPILIKEEEILSKIEQPKVKQRKQRVDR